MEYVVAVVWVVLSWWASTVAILYLDGLPDSTRRRSMLVGTALLPLALLLLWQAGRLTTPAGALLGYSGALAVWGWVELSFLLGFVTGPRRSMMSGSALPVHFAVPHGDMMIAGCFGLVRAWADVFPGDAGPILDSLEGGRSQVAPWELI